MRAWTSPSPEPIRRSRRVWRAVLLLSLSLLGAGLAQDAVPAPAVVPALECPPDETLLEVRVGGAARGTFLLRSGGAGADAGRVWLQREAFRGGEERYFDAELRCEGVNFARLRPDISSRSDLEKLSFSFEPQLELLGSQDLRIDTPPLEALASVPLFGLDYLLSGTADLRSNYSQRSEFRLNYTQNAVLASVGARQFWGSRAASEWLPYGLARYQPSSLFSAELMYNGRAEVGSLSGSLHGGRLELAGGLTRRWPLLEFTLPLEATLRLRVGGRTLKLWRSPPGKISLRDIPLEGNRGEIVVEIEDAAGFRNLSQPYEFPDVLLPQGGYTALLEGGLLSERLYTGGRLSYGLTPDLTLESRVAWSEQQAQGEVWALLSPPDQSLRVGFGGQISPSATHYDFRANYSASLRPFGVSVGVVVPFLDRLELRGNAALRWSEGPLGVSLSSTYDTALQELTSRLEASLRLESRVSLNAFASVKVLPGRDPNYTVGLSGNWRPDDQTTARAGSTLSSGGSLNSTLGVNYQFDGKNQASVLTNFESVDLRYSYSDRFEAELAANSSGSLSGLVQGSVALVQGQAYFGPGSVSSNYVLLQTGLPGVDILAGGRFVGTTNAAGDLVFSSPSGELLQIRVDLDSLPIEVSVQSQKRDVLLPGVGTYVVDWRSNFSRSRFVEFRWSAQEAVMRGEVRFEGAPTLYLDDLGVGFLEESTLERSGTLVSEDGARQCAVTIAATAAQVLCDLPRSEP